MSQPKTIFFLGATGYIGSQALDRILEADKTAKVTVLVRDKSKGEGFTKLDSRMTPVHGSLQDLNVLEDQAAKHDIVVNTADADAFSAANAINKGMARRTKETGKPGILIHTSGTGCLSDTANGAYAGDKIYTDYEADDSQSPPWNPITTLPDSALHRNVDLAIEAAAKAGDLRAYIVAPSTIYGLADNRFIQAQLANAQSQQMPNLIRIGVTRERPALIGEGKNIWNNIHTDDQADLFGAVYKHALKDDADPKETQYFIGENGEYVIGEAAHELGKSLAKRGIVKSATPEPLSKEELEKYTGGSTYAGGNSRGRAVRGKKIGWKPKYTTEDFIKSLETDVKWTLENKRGRGKDGKFQFGKGPQLKNGAWVMPGSS